MLYAMIDGVICEFEEISDDALEEMKRNGEDVVVVHPVEGDSVDLCDGFLHVFEEVES